MNKIREAMYNSIFENEHINEIAALQISLFMGVINFDEYITSSLKIIEGQLKQELGSTYIYAKAYYIQDEFYNLKPVGFCAESIENKVFFDCIKNAEKLTKKIPNSSLAEYVVKKQKLGIVLYKEENPKIKTDEIAQIIYFNIKDDNYDIFKKLDSDNELSTEHMVRHHKEYILQANQQNIYSYILRARNLDKDFNGTLYITLSEHLSINQYREIIDLFTYTIQARIKYEYKRELLNQDVIDELAHSWKYTISALRTQLYQIQDQQNIESFAQNMEIAITYTNDLNKRTNYLLNLMKKNDHATKTLLANPDYTASNPISLNEILRKSISTILLSVDVLEISDENHQVLLSNDCIPAVLESINSLDDYSLLCSKVGLEIVLEDLIKNAFFHTNYKEPIVSINTKIEGEYLDVSIINNVKINESYCRFINGYSTDLRYTAIKYKAGIRTVKRVVSSNMLTKSNTKCELKCSYTINPPSTIVSLRIPKSDVL